MSPRLTWVDGLLIAMAAFGILVGFSGLYQTVIGKPTVSLIKLACLATSACFAMQIARSLDRGEKARLGWWFMGVGLAAYALGQASLGVYQLRGLNPPFPFPGDLFFMVGALTILIALLRFTWVVLGSGLPVGSVGQHLLYAGVLAMFLGVLLFMLLVPILRSEQESSYGRLVNAYYTISSSVILLPAMVLFRISWLFRGGRILWAWGTTMLGMVGILIGDILFAYASVERLGHWSTQLMTVTFLLGYVVLCRGVLYHWQLLVGNESEAF